MKIVIWEFYIHIKSEENKDLTWNFHHTYKAWMKQVE